MLLYLTLPVITTQRLVILCIPTQPGNNVAVGRRSLYSNTGAYNSAFGDNASGNATGSFNTAFGLQTLFSNTTDNSAFGSDHYKPIPLGIKTVLWSTALYSNTTGYHNHAFGNFSMRHNTTGNNNLGLGYYALSTNVEGSQNTALGIKQVFNAVQVICLLVIKQDILKQAQISFILEATIVQTCFMVISHQAN